MLCLEDNVRLVQQQIEIVLSRGMWAVPVDYCTKCNSYFIEGRMEKDILEAAKAKVNEGFSYMDKKDRPEIKSVKVLRIIEE